MDDAYLYTAMAGDTFDVISLDFYGDERFSSTIIKANLRYCSVLTFQGGEQLRIPVIDEPVAATLPPWKQG
ncbi:hypothetical protein [Gorillibacterium sp. CAU 1737]|uniref:hypothetical protein n=1 Tax=Gorillibacterium sp. CAU 1737 TaxID=3140362 RepID=UPI0032615D40